jgi:hypothetical protein
LTVNNGADASFVSKKSYRVSVGTMNLDDVEPGIMFSIPKIPERPSSRVASSRPFFGRLGLPPMMFDPQLGEPIEFV